MFGPQSARLSRTPSLEILVNSPVFFEDVRVHADEFGLVLSDLLGRNSWSAYPEGSTKPTLVPFFLS